MEAGAPAPILRDAAQGAAPQDDGGVCGWKDSGPNKNEQAIRVSPNRLLVEDLTAFGYPRPAPLLAAGDHVFFDDTIPKPASRSAFINLFPCAQITLYLAPSFRDGPKDQTRNLEIPGSRLRLAPELTILLLSPCETHPDEP